MSLSRHCAELHEIAALLAEEATLIEGMSQNGAPAKQASVAQCYSAGLAQWALLIKPLQLAALDMATVNAWVV